MTERSDITITWGTSPRDVQVDDPSVTISGQDIVDTLRAREADLENLDKDSLLDAEGKAGPGGVTGIVNILQNATLSFEARVVVQETGTATTANPAGNRLIDSTATFITNGVSRGSIVSNETSGANASVLEVVSETELLTTPLIGGSRQTWLIGDSYNVFRTVACSAVAGDLFAVDDVGGSIDPVLATFGTSVIVEQSTSPAAAPIGADTVIADGFSLAEAITMILAAEAGNVSGGGTNTITITGADGTTTRIIATVDANGNRTVTFRKGD